ncbi:hypothetical protein SAMN02910358_01747 [Lachnospiraceae bacterium XBB1006]|nr:hypothetical protein SAMN02910358_01747 [Lachnospiraceae bacterium XBB1006]
MAYVDVKAASYNAEKQIAEIQGIDLDNVLLNDWNQEFTEKVITFRFDLAGKGPRIYLYKILRTVVKDECHSVEEMLLKLPGKITNISSNFIAKAE